MRRIIPDTQHDNSLPTHTATERQHKQHINTQENARGDVEISQ